MELRKHESLGDLLYGIQPPEQPYTKIENNNFKYVEKLVEIMGGSIEYLLPSESVLLFNHLKLYLASKVELPEHDSMTVKEFSISDLFRGFKDGCDNSTLRKQFSKSEQEYFNGFSYGVAARIGAKAIISKMSNYA